MAKHFMIYYPTATSNGEAFLRQLQEVFGEAHIYQLNGSGAFVIKVPSQTSFPSVMDKLGLNEQKRQSGVLIEFDNSNINGWYSQALWSFIKEDIANG